MGCPRPQGSPARGASFVRTTPSIEREIDHRQGYFAVASLSTKNSFYTGESPISAFLDIEAMALYKTPSAPLGNAEAFYRNLSIRAANTGTVISMITQERLRVPLCKQR